MPLAAAAAVKPVNLDDRDACFEVLYFFLEHLGNSRRALVAAELFGELEGRTKEVVQLLLNGFRVEGGKWAREPSVGGVEEALGGAPQLVEGLHHRNRLLDLREGLHLLLQQALLSIDIGGL